MKFFRIGAAALCVFAAFSASADETEVPANNSGWVKFSGTVTASACKVVSNSVNSTVNLGEITTGELRAGQSSTPVPFEIKLSECSNKTVAVIKLTDKYAGSQPAANLRLSDKSEAKGVAVAISQNNTDINFAQESSRTINVDWGNPIDDGSASVAFTARMVASDTEAIQAGSVEAQMDYTVEYK